MQKLQKYREHARRCELLLEKVEDPRVRQQLRRERQEWLELAASCEAALRNERWAGERPLDQDMTLAALRALEARGVQEDVQAATPALPPGSPQGARRTARRRKARPARQCAGSEVRPHSDRAPERTSDP